MLNCFTSLPEMPSFLASSQVRVQAQVLPLPPPPLLPQHCLFHLLRLHLVQLRLHRHLHMFQELPLQSFDS